MVDPTEAKVTDATVPASPSALDFVARAVDCRKRDDLRGAADAAARALELDPRRMDALMMAAWVAVRQGDSDRAIPYYRRLAELAPNTPRFPFEIVHLLFLSGNVSDASNELTSALARWPDDPSLRSLALRSGLRSPEELVASSNAKASSLVEREFRALLEVGPPESKLLRPIVADDKTSEVAVAQARNAETGVIVFTALNDSLSMPLPTFDRYLAALGVTAIYLKDHRRLSYLTGIASLGKDYSATVAALRERWHRLQVRRMCTLGYSDGGAAAVRYGVELSAERVVSFCGLSHVAQNDTPRPDQVYRLIKQRMASQMPPEHGDLRQFLVGRRHSTKIEWLYPEGAARDKAYAEYLTGISGITFHPIPGCDQHGLPRWLALNHDLLARLARHLDLRPSS
jgi:tetratricopeptide (TPR) repeat protein